MGSCIKVRRVPVEANMHLLSPDWQAVHHDLETDDKEHVCQAEVHECGAVSIGKRKMPPAKHDISRAVSPTYHLCTYRYCDAPVFANDDV
jgi:hypothetical protein